MFNNKETPVSYEFIVCTLFLDTNKCVEGWVRRMQN